MLTVLLFTPLSLLVSFSEQIHIWYPVLHPNFAEQFLYAVTHSFPPSPDSCLSLLVLAIGSLVEYESHVHAIRERPYLLYIESALAMIPNVILDNSVRSAQCLILASVFFNCIIKPCHAHDFIAMASLKIQSILKRYEEHL